MGKTWQQKTPKPLNGQIIYFTLCFQGLLPLASTLPIKSAGIRLGSSNSSGFPWMIPLNACVQRKAGEAWVAFLTALACGSHQWHIFSLACLQCWTLVHPICYFTGSILVFSQKGRATAGKWKMSKIFPSNSAISYSETLGINLHGTVKMHTEKASSAQIGKSKDHSRKINLNLLVSFV